MEDHKCAICDEIHYQSKDNKRPKKVNKAPVGASMKNTLIKKSKNKNDGKWEKWQNEDIYIHENCRALYYKDPRKMSLSSAEVPSDTSTTTFSIFDSSTDDEHDNDFDFKVSCIFCAKKWSSQEGQIVQRSYQNKRILDVVQTCHESSIVKIRLHNVTSLIDLNARYHDKCYEFFLINTSLAVPTSSKRSLDFEAEEMYNKVYERIEAGGSEPILSSELKKIMGEHFPDTRTFYKKLKCKYNDDILFLKHAGQETQIFYKNFNLPQIASNWLCGKNMNDHQKKFIVDIAADIINTEIKLKNYNTESYKPPGNFLDTVRDDIPILLFSFLTRLICGKKNKQKQHQINSILTIAHMIISAIKTLNFISYLQLAIGTYVLRKTGSKLIIDILSSLGVCPSYYHLRLYEASVLLDPPKLIINEAYSQYVFDNTDHNVITIDGHKTFHCLGGIWVLTPDHEVSLEGESKKLSKMPPSSQIASVNEIPDVNLPIDCKGNIDKITFEDTNKLNLGNSDYLPLHYTTYLWLKHLNFSGIPSWHGFLEKMYGEEISHSTSRVMCLPFINHKATEYLSIHTALTYSIQQAKKNNQIIVFVTFDLPLYKIARDICTSLQDTDLKYVYVRLGGFHMLMSYLGGIGNIMEGSGLSELWSTVYAPKSVKHLLAGHAFTRSVRANILTYTALGHLICEQIDKDKVKELKDYLNELFNDIDQDPYNGPYIGDCNSDDNICKMNEKFIQELKRLKYYGPTAKLWIQYFECITIMLQYIEAERTGNWMLYLQSVKKMLPLFHASGHFLYARCAQLYLQDMASLEKNMTVEEYNKFTRDGYFTVHRTDKCFNAVWTDMSIEQTLNRFFGTDLVHGRGVTDSVISRYLGAMPTCYMIMENLEDFCNVKTQNSEQHIQLLKARIKLDNDHLEIFKSWFTKHDSLIQRTSIVSLSTGVMGGSEINCYEAIKKGEENMVNMIGENSKTFSFNRLMLVKNLASAKKRAHLSGKHESVDPLEFFRVISSSLQKLPASGLKNILKHELSPYPLSLFNKKGFMRQCDQNIYDIIKKTYNFVDNFVHDLTIILDGDFLLDAVSSWPQCRTFKIICDLYLDYIKKKFNSQIEMKRLYIVFHLYHNEVCGVKSYNQLRQSEKSIAADFDLDYDALCSMTKKQFLSNVCNKQKFVLMLQEYLKNTANVRMVDEDCTEAIVKEAVQLATQYSNPVGVVTNNVEPLLLLITQCPTSLRRYIYYCKYNHEGKPMEINPIYLFDDCRSFILFCHVFGGCESTSGIYSKKKKTILNFL
ncbi:uncharacterized protein LOC122848794 [Aphidius gifuensis]|uniref:uncharacterized protein LOC122848794 n=1 Tax=Aphidius gifuensis TaxID=684658 RepID=UPI001CDBCBC3|nr:uncharacterized protein LOC122848794 [Aphidius gifuensis]